MTLALTPRRPTLSLASEPLGSPSVAPDGPPLDLAALAREFLTYLADYRQASPLTVEAYRRDLVRFGRFLVAHRLPQEVTRMDTRTVQAFAVAQTGLAPATICRMLNALSSFFGYLQRAGIVDRNPVEGVVKPKARAQVPQAPNLETCRALVQAARSPRERAMVMLLLTAGLRRAELLDLRVADLSADLSQVTVLGKGQRLRTIPLPAQTQQALASYLTQRDGSSELLFTNRAGHRIGNTSFYRMFRRWLRRAGANGEITPHSLRHQYATTLLHSGVDVKTCQELLGHADLSTTSRYLHTTDDTKRAAANALPTYAETSQPGGEG